MREPTAQEIWDILKQTGKVFLTGPGGCGKSWTTNEIALLAKEEKHTVVYGASTGVAARNLNKEGGTIHSILGIGISNNVEEYKNNPRTKFAKLAIPNVFGLNVLLVIDEVSMISSSLLELILYVVETKLKNVNLKILLVGDFLQLESVNKQSSRETIFAFENHRFNEFSKFALFINKRNEDKAWNIFLNRVRYGEFNGHDTDYLRTLPNIHVLDDPPEDDSNLIILDSVNSQVEAINNKKLMELPGDYITSEYKLEASKEAPLQAKDWLFKNEKKVLKDFGNMYFNFKIGTKVLITANNKELGVINGDVGIVTAAYGSEEVFSIDVEVDGRTVNIKQKEHEVFHPTLRDSEKNKIKIGFINHFPLKLGYALTVHKSQGSSLAKMYFNPSHVFLPAQTYVALSRLKTHGDLYIPTLELSRFVWCNEKAIRFQKEIEQKEILGILRD